MNPNTDPIPFARPSIDTREEEAVVRVLRSGWLTTGSEAQAFEIEFARAVGAEHARAVSSATAGLHLALESLGVTEGDTVITTPYTFTATAEVVRYLGAEVRFVDIEPEGFNIDPIRVEEALEIGDDGGAAVPKVIMPVHIGGYPCDMARLLDVAGNAGAEIVEDAAHAFPVATRLGYLGAIGSIGVYSFYANKTITTGEGGMVVTSSTERARRIGVMRNHGIDRDAWDRYTRTGASWEYAVVAPGYKYNMPDVAAAIGRVQLAKAEELHRRRRERAEQYLEALSGLDYLVMPPHSGPNAWHLFIIGLELERLSISRDEVIRCLAERGIGTSVHYIPLHTMPYYRDRYSLRPTDFPNALRRFRRSISLPLYADMSEEAVGRVSAAVREICERAYVPKTR